MTKVLVAAPTFDGMRYCQNDFLDRIKNLDFEGYDLLLVDNSRSSDYSKELENKGFSVIHDPTTAERSVYRLISSRNLIIDHALRGGYSHLLMLDSDVVPPRDILSRLLSCKKSIVSGLYYNFFLVSGERKWLPVAWKLLTEEELSELKRLLPQYANIPRDELRRHITDKEISSGKLLDVVMPSAGCMLISREVFSVIRYGKFSDSGGADDDRFFIDRAIKAGFQPFCLPSVLCEHLVKEKYVSDSKGNYYHSSFSDMLKK